MGDITGIVRRNDTATATGSADGAVAALQVDATGRLYTNVQTTNGYSTTGSSVLRDSSVVATDETCTTTATTVTGVHLQNPNTAEAWFHLYNGLIANVTVGSTTPVISYWLPPSGSYDAFYGSQDGIRFSTAVAYAATTTFGGSSAPSTGIVANILYRTS